MTWQDRALCKETDPEKFFPIRGATMTAQEAKKVCRRCLVRPECLTYALTHQERFGVWGGLSGPERRALEKEIERHQPGRQA